MSRTRRSLFGSTNARDTFSDAEDAMAVIAMTREIGARGSDVAAGLADRLRLEIVHHELVEHDIAARTGLSEDEIHRHLEGEAFLIERLTLDKRRLSRYTAQEILE